MSIPFAQSTRSIQADGMRAIHIGIAATVLLTLFWGLWFMLAQIPRYETSTAAHFTKDGLIVAGFTSEALARIRRGQSAVFEFTDAAEQSHALLATVADIDRATGQIRLIPHSDVNRSLGGARSGLPRRYNLRDGTPGVVDVVVEQISPAKLVMRAAGLGRTS